MNTMYDHTPTVRARALGLELQRALDDAGLNGSQIAERLGCSPSKVSRMLSGKRHANRTHVAAFLALCGVKSPQWDPVLELTDDVYNPVWWQDFGSGVPTRIPARDELEASASKIVCYGNALVPDLLHTPGYTRAVLGVVPAISDDDLEDRTADTVRRQEILERPAPPELVVYLDEHVLTRTGAGDDIMSDQAHHLLRLALRPEIQVRAISADRPVGDVKPFTLFRFGDYPPVVLVEYPTSVAYLENPATIATYETVLVALRQAALDTTSTRDWLAELGRRRSPHPMIAGTPDRLDTTS
jgi:transcriptional regulator with XRE-family HTH domain